MNKKMKDLKIYEVTLERTKIRYVLATGIHDAQEIAWRNVDDDEEWEDDSYTKEILHRDQVKDEYRGTLIYHGGSEDIQVEKALAKWQHLKTFGKKHYFSDGRDLAFWQDDGRAYRLILGTPPVHDVNREVYTFRAHPSQRVPSFDEEGVKGLAFDVAAEEAEWLCRQMAELGEYVLLGSGTRWATQPALHETDKRLFLMRSKTAIACALQYGRAALPEAVQDALRIRYKDLFGEEELILNGAVEAKHVKRHKFRVEWTGVREVLVYENSSGWLYLGGEEKD